MLSKRLSLLFFLILFLATISSFFNSLNVKNLAVPQATKVFLNLIARQESNEATYSTKLSDLVASSAAVLATTPASSVPAPTPIVTTAIISSTATTNSDPFANDPDLKDAAWGQAVQVSETGYRMKVGFDPIMAEPKETFQALNLYRYTKGKSNLTWDDRLAKYALERATYICQNGSDGHAGFSDYVENQEGYKTLGFYSLGENMSTHMKFTGTHLIEWMYAADPAHDGNQLGDWSHVGVGIYDDCSVLIFGNDMI